MICTYSFSSKIRKFHAPEWLFLSLILYKWKIGILRSHQLTSDLPILPVMSEIAPTTSIAPDDGSRYLPGFQVGGNGQCLNVDDCQLYPDFCKSQQECLNTIGSFRYFCPYIYRLYWVLIAHRLSKYEEILNLFLYIADTFCNKLDNF